MSGFSTVVGVSTLLLDLPWALMHIHENRSTNYINIAMNKVFVDCFTSKQKVVKFFSTYFIDYFHDLFTIGKVIPY